MKKTRGKGGQTGLAGEEGSAEYPEPGRAGEAS